MCEKKLVVIGDGTQIKKVKSLVSSNIEVMGFQSSETIREYMQRAKAFVFAAVEDFGIVTVEAQACGTPVIAYGKGGSLETVIENETGIFFYRQHPDDIIKAVKRFENGIVAFDPAIVHNNAKRFAEERFKKEFKDFVEKAVNYHYDNVNN